MASSCNLRCNSPRFSQNKRVGDYSRLRNKHFGDQVLEDLIELLSKINTQKKPVGVEVNYDGRKFSWKFKVSNIKAHEWHPKKTSAQTAAIEGNWRT